MGGYEASRTVTTQLLAGLVSYGEDDEIVPDVAERWDLSEDGRRYTFRLRDDVVWDDGAPVTAHDFVFTYRRALDPATAAPCAPSLLTAVRGASAVRAGEGAAQLAISSPDDHTLVVELVEPTSYFIHNLAYPVLLPTPRHVVEQHGAAWATPGHLVGNGAFRVGHWEPGRMLLLERNPRYHGRAAGNVEQVRLDLAAEPSEYGALYAADELDVVEEWWTGVEQFDAIRRRFPSELVTRPGFATWACVPNTHRPPLDDLRVRRALAMAIDRRAVADLCLRGLATAADTGGVVPPGMAGHVPDCWPAHDPGQAAWLLSEARGELGELPEVTIITYAASIGRLLYGTWRAVGLRCGLEVVGRRVALDTARRTNRPWVLVAGWIADYPDPDDFLRVWVEDVLGAAWHDRYPRALEEAARALRPGGAPEPLRGGRADPRP